MPPDLELAQEVEAALDGCRDTEGSLNLCGNPARARHVCRYDEVTPYPGGERAARNCTCCVACSQVCAYAL